MLILFYLFTFFYPTYFVPRPSPFSFFVSSSRRVLHSPSTVRSLFKQKLRIVRPIVFFFEYPCNAVLFYLFRRNAGHRICRCTVRSSSWNKTNAPSSIYWWSAGGQSTFLEEMAYIGGETCWIVGTDCRDISGFRRSSAHVLSIRR